MLSSTYRALAGALLLFSCGDGSGSVVIKNPPPPTTPDANLSLDPASVLLPPGETAQYTVAMQGSVTGTWTLSVVGLPQGVTGIFDPVTVSPGQTSTLGLSADPSAPNATVTVTVTASEGELGVSAQAQLVVQSDDEGTGGGTAATGGGDASGGGSAANGGGGGAVDPCPGYADPNTPADCTCSTGHACAANHCYGGWYCSIASKGCVAPPSGCTSAGGGAGGGGTGGGGVTATGGGSASGSGGSGATGGGGSNSSGVGPTGGTVSLLHFGITGDTRPPNCEDTAGYPTAIINGIADAMQAKRAQFVFDLGDHMYVCNNTLSIAQTQMGLYMQSVQRYSGTWFMTMGNHECTSGPCLLGSTNANYTAFMAALAPISSKPYYAFNIETSLGRATFVTVADNAWDSAQSTWLTQTLTAADSSSKYTIVLRHHPEGDTSVSTNATIMSIIRQHKFALFLTGHAHSYSHMTTDSGRDLVMGLGGAPLLASGATYHGYAMIDQQASGTLTVTVYDVAGTVHDTWSVGPN